MVRSPAGSGLWFGARRRGGDRAGHGAGSVFAGIADAARLVAGSVFSGVGTGRELDGAGEPAAEFSRWRVEAARSAAQAFAQAIGGAAEGGRDRPLARIVFILDRVEHCLKENMP